MILNEYQCAGRWFSVLYRQFQIFINGEMREHGINSTEYICLINIEAGQKVNQKHFADVLFIDNAIITRSLKSLEQKKLIKREKSDSDKRETLITLTKEGLITQDICKEILKKWADIVYKNMSIEQKELMIELLAHISQNVLSINKGEQNEYK